MGRTQSATCCPLPIPWRQRKHANLTAARYFGHLVGVIAREQTLATSKLTGRMTIVIVRGPARARLPRGRPVSRLAASSPADNERAQRSRLIRMATHFNGSPINHTETTADGENLLSSLKQAPQTRRHTHTKDATTPIIVRGQRPLLRPGARSEQQHTMCSRAGRSSTMCTMQMSAPLMAQINRSRRRRRRQHWHFVCFGAASALAR